MAATLWGLVATAIVEIVLLATGQGALPILVAALPVFVAGALGSTYIERRLRSQARIPAGHVEEIKAIALQLVSDLDAVRTPTFGADPDQNRVLRESFRSHFPKVFRDLGQWSTLLAAAQLQDASLSQRVTTEARGLEQAHGLNYQHVEAVLRRTADSQLVATPAPAAEPRPFSSNWIPRMGLLLFLGGSSIGSFSSAEALAAAQTAFSSAAVKVASWDQIGSAREARLTLLRHKETLRRELVEISRRHTLPNRCRLCSAP